MRIRLCACYKLTIVLNVCSELENSEVYIILDRVWRSFYFEYATSGENSISAVACFVYLRSSSFTESRVSIIWIIKIVEVIWKSSFI